jgi:hypothetical protein
MCTDYGLGKDLLAIQKRVRIQLFNIGTNPMKRGVIFFQNDQPLMGNILQLEPRSGRESKDELLNKDTRIPSTKLLESRVEGRLSQNREILDNLDLNQEEPQYTVKIFKASNSRQNLLVPIERFKSRIPDFDELGFTAVDKTRFSWNLMIERPSSVLTYEKIIAIVNEYIQLMVKMSASLNDESINQVKNIGLSETFCLYMVRRKDAHPKFKASLLELYIKMQLGANQLAADSDDYSFR